MLIKDLSYQVRDSSWADQELLLVLPVKSMNL